MTHTDTPSLADRIRPVAAGAEITAAHFLDHTAFFVLGEEFLLAAEREGESRQIRVHSGAILASACDGERIITAGDDGKLVATSAVGETRTIVTDAKRRWIDHVSLGPDGAVAWSAGSTAFVQSAKREVRSLEVPSTVGGLAFAPRGFRLAISHYNGVTLWFPNALGAIPEKLEWQGSHLDVIFSPDGRFLVTAMQEPTLHGWRLADRKDMRMSGYAGKVRSMGWTADGKWLATSGSDQLILWPFQGKDGPMGKSPRLLAPTPGQVTRVSPHPRAEIVAVGYDNGLVLLSRIDDGGEILIKHPGAGAVSALAWSADGALLAFGTEEGEAGILAV